MKYFLSLIVTLILLSCSNPQKKETESEAKSENTIGKFKWLIGVWENNTDGGKIFESWEEKNDSVLSGKSFMVMKGDTQFFESVELILKGGKYYYVPSVKNQNNGQPVYFKFSLEQNGEYVFENKEHDFPQRIIYSNPSKDSLSARIEGMEHGNFRKEEFPFRRSVGY